MAGEDGTIDVQSFVAQMGLDDKVQAELYALSAEQQHIVMGLVMQQECRNPSAVTWSKVKATKQDAASVKVEFIKNALDERASVAFAAVLPHLQRAVAADVNVLECKNISAVVWSKIKGGVQTHGVGSGLANGAGAGGINPMARARSLGLDEGAMEMFAALSPTQQMLVITGVERENCRNPSAVVIRRITQVKQCGVGAAEAAITPIAGARSRSRTPPPSLLPIPFAYAGIPVMPMTQASAIDAKAMAAIADLPAEQQHIVFGLVSREQCKNPSAFAWTKVKQIRENATALKLEFITKSIDEKAAAAVSQLTEDVLTEIFADVDVSKCRNLSAVLWSKVKGMVSAPVALETAIETSSSSDNSLTLDDRAEEALQTLSVDDQKVIREELEEVKPKNPSAFVWSRVKKLQTASA